ncbi:MAG TPA: DUF2935 domain-containing protein [Gammaproteobacteria bacterium]
MTPSLALRTQPKDFVTHVRSKDGSRSESKFEKEVILPALDQQDVCLHAWADARFAVENMAEHAQFFALQMPQELAPREHDQAEQFEVKFKALLAKIAAEGPPQADAVKAFCETVIKEIKPFIAFKEACREAQASGKLYCLIWPLAFEHTQREAQRWCRRLQGLGLGDAEFDRAEVSTFWTGSMDEDCRFIAHLLDPEEYALIDACMKTSSVFRHLNRGGTGGVVASLVGEPGSVVVSLVKNQATYEILSCAEAILDLKTKLCRDIEGGRVKSMMIPAMADHLRRESIKFVDELKRAV